MSESFDEPTTAEADPRDVAEQHAAATAEPGGTVAAPGVPLEASEADAVEQSAEVPDDEWDEYPG